MAFAGALSLSVVLPSPQTAAVKMFGAEGESHERLCLAATERTLATALSRFREFILELICHLFPTAAN